MVINSKKLYFSTTIFLLVILFCAVTNVSALFTDCWGQSSGNGGTRNSCNALGCVWASDNSSEVALNITNFYDPFCNIDEHCCMPNECWQFDGNQSGCTSGESSLSGVFLNCSWDPFMTYWYPNGTQAPPGGCMNDWASGGEWGGITEGCWKYDGDKASCSAQGSGCKWTANDQNQDPWCWIKSLTDAQGENPSATTTDIGCCETSGCWINDGNQTACQSSFQGNCWYDTFGGWCNTKWCGEITTEANCTYAQQNLFMPCNWTGSACNELGSSGFDFYSNDSDSCFSAGGWYNATGDCVMPDGGIGGGAGGFLFGNEAHCWFADNKADVCGNITGCIYCVAGNGIDGVDNNTATNICSRKQAGFCEGHATEDSGIPYDNLDGYNSLVDNSANLNCSHIKVKSACTYGPLPNCKWTNSSTIVGAYCEAGASSEKKSAPPVQYCEDPLSKNNYTLCMQLADTYMMPCKWQNTTYPITNCTFNGNAVFGEGGEKDFGVINSQFACTSSGGTWNTEFYIDGAILKQDSWCEMTGMFDIDQGTGVNNKMNCDTSCWACEFQSNGSAWNNAAAAQASCTGSDLGYCKWSTDSSAFNGFGWCDFPEEMEDGGAKDCDLECKGCDFMINPEQACNSSMANNGVGCKWVSEGTNNYCVDKTKKVCATDCFSCFDLNSCQSSSLSCSWDSTFNLCSPDGFTGEVCFDGIDNDADTFVDCGDPDCGFDNFCGGSSFGGDCFAKTTQGTCNQTVAFGGLNCSWINDTWNPTGWCDMPGANCWKFDDNLVTCGATPGCTNDSSSLGASQFCDLNKTLMENSNCWQYNNESACGLSVGNCEWRNDTWCAGDGFNTTWCNDNPNAGWCDFKPFADCMDKNESTCGLNSNCTWKQDQYSGGGWCDVACFNPDWNETSCENASLNGLCEYRDMSQTCQPSTFMMFGSGGSSGKTGCWQYDGNQTGCLANGITCTYKNDSFSRNNLSATEPSGWCMDKSEFEHFGEMEGDVIDLAFDSDNMGGAESGVDKEVDMLGTGMRVTDTGFDFGAGILNVTETMLCNGYGIGNPNNFTAEKVPGNGNKTTKFYWYLDTDGNTSSGCVAPMANGSNLTGFDFMVSYVSRNTSTGISETKKLERCFNSVWSPTNALVTTSKKLSCGEIGGVMIAISKQDLESFAEYNKTVNMRIFMSSANDTDTRLLPSDSLGPSYYTPGTIDFGFIDCADPTMSKDPKCKNFQKFGFNVFEECKNGIDDDENGMTDCDDPFCKFIPDCASAGGAFNFINDVNDVTSPVVVFSEVERLHDSAFLKVDTSEPSNLTLMFYKNDSTCKTLNLSLTDTGTGYQANANFKPFHSVDLMQETLGYVLTNGTAYYYKIKVCDPSENCAVSACTNFTTKSTAQDKSFLFKMDLPDGYTVDIPALNKTNYNFSESFGGVSYEVGIKTNTSVTKNMNMTLHCGDMAIGLYGMNVLDPTKIDLSNAFVCNETNDYIGMNSTLKKWNKLIDDLHLGGASDYIEITLPLAYNANNVLNWTDDDGRSNGQNVNNYVNCSDGGSSNTKCKIPVSMGFSAYSITAPASSSPATPSSGGGGSSTVTTPTVALSDTQFNSGYSANLKVGSRFKVTVASQDHFVSLNSITPLVANITLSSTPQTVLLVVGESSKFELTGDNYYDIIVTINSINRTLNLVNMTLKSTYEKVPVVAVAPITGGAVTETEEKVAEESVPFEEPTNIGEIKKDLTNLWMIAGAVLIVLACIGGGVYFWNKGKTSSKKGK
ncbi:MAG TPA: hypothetical protein HA283_05420 [Nanoarchaeota archaeon]|nr:hypothetical protein [Nanoarchaeota archaeon]HIH63707.1 hypothetical protein [Nanoarchaeota archaeon]HIJ09580.1 hypothetical protein [Nanoarchaeota archaeon]